jgi:membrane protein
LFLALFPFFIFLAALGGFVADLLNITNPTEEIMRELEGALPSDAASVIRGQVETIVNSRSATLISVGIVGAIWAASSGIGTIMKAMNVIYEVRETRSFIKRSLLTVLLTMLSGFFLIGAFIILVFGQIYGMKLADEMHLEGVAKFLFSWGRWPIVIALLLFATAFIYWATPNAKLPFKWITPGALLFAVGWVGLSYLFGLYVASFGSYNVTYGALGGIVVLLIWFYLTGFILLLGAEVNAVLAQEFAPAELVNSTDGATAETVPNHKKGAAGVAASGGADGQRVVGVGSRLLLFAGFIVALLVSGRRSKTRRIHFLPSSR